MQTIVVPGDPTEELLYQARAQQADLIVLGAQGASAFAAITRHGVVYKVLAHSHCPVMTLSPAVLAKCGVKINEEHQAEVFWQEFSNRLSGYTNRTRAGWIQTDVAESTRRCRPPLFSDASSARPGCLIHDAAFRA